jgi:hypothetical protein
LYLVEGVFKIRDNVHGDAMWYLSYVLEFVPLDRVVPAAISDLDADAKFLEDGGYAPIKNALSR